MLLKGEGQARNTNTHITFLSFCSAIGDGRAFFCCGRAMGFVARSPRNP